MDYKLMFPSQYLAADDLKGRDVIVEIEQIKSKRLRFEDNSTESMWLMRFVGKKKAWLLKVTSAKVIAKLYGSETDGWIGKSITLYPTTCPAFGETVDCVRVRPTVPQTSRPAPADDDWADEKAMIAAAEAEQQ